MIYRQSEVIQTMARLFILIKRKGAKSYRDAIPARAGVTKAMLQKKARKQIKPGYTFRIITETQLKSILLTQARQTRRGVKVRKRRKSRKRR